MMSRAYSMISARLRILSIVSLNFFRKGHGTYFFWQNCRSTVRHSERSIWHAHSLTTTWDSHTGFHRVHPPTIHSCRWSTIDITPIGNSSAHDSSAYGYLGITCRNISRSSPPTQIYYSSSTLARWHRALLASDIAHKAFLPDSFLRQQANHWTSFHKCPIWISLTYGTQTAAINVTSHYPLQCNTSWLPPLDSHSGYQRNTLIPFFTSSLALPCTISLHCSYTHARPWLRHIVLPSHAVSTNELFQLESTTIFLDLQYQCLDYTGSPTLGHID